VFIKFLYPLQLH